MKIAYTTLAKAFTQIISVAVLVACPITMGVEQAGGVFLFLSYLNIMSVVFRFGSDQGMLHSLSNLINEMEIEKSIEKLKGYIKLGYLSFVVSIFLLSSLKVFGIIDFTFIYIFGLATGALCLSIAIGYSIYEQCSNRPSFAIALQACVQIITIISILYVFIFSATDFYRVFFIIAVLIVLTFSYSLFLAPKKNYANVTNTNWFIGKDKIVNFNIWFVTLLQTFLQWGITAVAGLLLVRSDVTVLHTLIRLYAFSAVPLIILNTVFLPKIAILHNDGEYGRLWSEYLRLMRYSLICGLIIIVVIKILSPIYSSLTNVHFDNTPIIELFIISGYIVNSLVGPVGGLLIATKLESFYRSALVFSTLLGVCLIFISPFEDPLTKLSFAYAVMLITQNLIALSLAYFKINVEGHSC